MWDKILRVQYFSKKNRCQIPGIPKPGTKREGSQVQEQSRLHRETLFHKAKG